MVFEAVRSAERSSAKTCDTPLLLARLRIISPDSTLLDCRENHAILSDWQMMHNDT